jgi:hypothetical protein
VAADGTLLEGLPVEGRLPTVRADGRLRGQRLADGDALGAVRVAGAAPGPLHRRLEKVERDGERGFVATLRDGPELVFGEATRLRAKWLAAARVLADAESQGASYLDLRVPGRPAAGGVPYESTAPAPTALAPAPPMAGGEPAAPVSPGTEALIGPEGETAPGTGEPPAAVAPPPAEAPAEVPPAVPQAPAAPTGGAGGGAAAAPVP